MTKSQAAPKIQNAPTSISNGSYTILKYTYVYTTPITGGRPALTSTVGRKHTIFQLLLYRLREPHVARWCRAAEVACRRCLHHTESHPDWADRVITDVGRVQVHRKEVEREIEREVRKISNIFYICLFIHTTRE